MKILVSLLCVASYTFALKYETWSEKVNDYPLAKDCEHPLNETLLSSTRECSVYCIREGKASFSVQKTTSGVKCICGGLTIGEEGRWKSFVQETQMGSYPSRYRANPSSKMASQ